jgi:hypothetical protein
VDEMEIVNPNTGKNRYKLNADGVVTPAPAKAKCFRCDGTGLICDTCGESEAVCGCLKSGLSESFSDCTDCTGTGK